LADGSIAVLGIEHTPPGSSWRRPIWRMSCFEAPSRRRLRGFRIDSLRSIPRAIDHPSPPLARYGIVLRRFRVDDFERAVEASEDAATEWGASMPAADASGVVAYLEECRRDGVLLDLVIASASTDAYLGEVTIAVGEHAVAEIGCLLAPDARGRGHATEAFDLVVPWAFKALGLARIQAFVAVTNPAGLALTERAGFRREGVLRAYLELDGARVDAVVLSRLPTD
jgi:RimJ/RimL family protein N-acetyltransferase